MRALVLGVALLLVPAVVRAQTSGASAAEGAEELVQFLRPGAAAVVQNIHARAPERDPLAVTVRFASGSDRLRPSAVRTLERLGRALAEQARLRIEGHADTEGGPAANAVLSARRAAAVSRYLTSQFGVDPSRLVVVGLGQDGLLVPTADGVAEAQNRRVLIVPIGE